MLISSKDACVSLRVIHSAVRLHHRSIIDNPSRLVALRRLFKPTDNSMLGGPTFLLVFLALLALCTGDQWLMEGDFITESEAMRRRLVVEAMNSTTSVSSSARVSVSAPPGHSINCVLAAALHMNGDVRLTEGGVGFANATVSYRTNGGGQDLLFVLIESHAEESDDLATVALEKDRAESSRVVIVYDRVDQWRSELLGGSGKEAADATEAPGGE